MKSFTLSLTLLLTSAQLGCQAQNASSLHENVVADPLRHFQFPTENLQLDNNKLFFWPEARTAGDVETVLTEAKNVDRLDLEGSRLAARMKPIEEKRDELNSEIRGFRKTVRTLVKDLTVLEQAIAVERGRGNDANADRIRELQLLIDGKKAELVVAESRLFEKLSELAPVEAELMPLTARANEITVGGTASVAAIAKVADWFQTHPLSILITPVLDLDGKRRYGVEIRGWKLCFEDRDLGPLGPGFPETGEDCGGSSRNFATGDGSIVNTIYRESGGIFEFDVVINARVTYHLKMLRNRYADADRDGGNYFGGEITRTIVGDRGELLYRRQGVVKLADRNNPQ